MRVIERIKGILPVPTVGLVVATGRSLMLTLLLPACAFAAFGQTNESVEVIEDVNTIVVKRQNTSKTTVVVTTADGQEGRIYKVEGNDNESLCDNPCGWGGFDVPFRPSTNKGVWSGTAMKWIYGGWLMNHDDGHMLEHCSEWGVMNVMGANLHPFRKGPELNIGVGFGVRIYNTKPNSYFYKNSFGGLELQGNSPVDKSRLNSWTFHLPVILSQKIYKRLGVSVGALLNFNTYATVTNTNMVDNHEKITIDYKDFHQRFFTVDLIGMVGLKDIAAFYCRWSPTPSFDKQWGPDFRTLSMGFVLNY